ncbi:uncharacterized protein LOC118444955 isoform X2 [Vespa mandarinia]|uniref:uncharacterized protein LOC118444955 isoform X2 n=1 Tax=Vespa mandarinia TaxID=7446 RepID=UPI0016210A98|nr:uncharacterized protein LOC118444955 isoform X2 [Vespa mandarinia]
MKSLALSKKAKRYLLTSKRVASGLQSFLSTTLLKIPYGRKQVIGDTPARRSKLTEKRSNSEKQRPGTAFKSEEWIEWLTSVDDGAVMRVINITNA